MNFIVGIPCVYIYVLNDLTQSSVFMHGAARDSSPSVQSRDALDNIPTWRVLPLMNMNL